MWDVSFTSLLVACQTGCTRGSTTTRQLQGKVKLRMKDMTRQGMASVVRHDLIEEISCHHLWQARNHTFHQFESISLSVVHQPEKGASRCWKRPSFCEAFYCYSALEMLSGGLTEYTYPTCGRLLSPTTRHLSLSWDVRSLG